MKRHSPEKENRLPKNASAINFKFLEPRNFNRWFFIRGNIPFFLLLAATIKQQ